MAVLSACRYKLTQKLQDCIRHQIHRELQALRDRQLRSLCSGSTNNFHLRLLLQPVGVGTEVPQWRPGVNPGRESGEVPQKLKQFPEIVYTAETIKI